MFLHCETLYVALTLQINFCIRLAARDLQHVHSCIYETIDGKCKLMANKQNDILIA
jgi:hypothetical protein